MLVVLGVFTQFAYGHEASVSKIKLDLTLTGINLSVVLPEDQLLLSLPSLESIEDVDQPKGNAILRDYFAKHLWLTQEGRRYDGEITAIERITDKQSGVAIPVLKYSVDFPLDAMQIVLHSDLVQHQVISHKSYIMLGSGHLKGSDPSVVLGVLRLKHNDISVDLSDVSAWLGIRSMFVHGIEHIPNGADHLLFLICLLLTIPLSVQREAGGLKDKNTTALSQTIGLVSVFTLSHSLALLMTLLSLIPIGGTYVELIVVLSVACSAVIVVKPKPIELFDKYALVLVFGFAHGLAFSKVLSDMSLSKVDQALELLSFTLGIELMQIVLAILLVPCFMVLSKHQTIYLYLRRVASLFALVASVGWLFERIQGEPNTIVGMMEQALLWLPGLYLLLILLVLWDSAKAYLPTPKSVERLRN